LIAWLAALLLIGGGCASFGTRLEAPEVSLVDIKPLASEGFEQRFEIRLRVSNPNAKTLSGDGIDLTLEVNGKRLGRALSAEPFEIPRLGDRVVALVATTNFLDLVRQAFTLPARQGRIDYAVRGRVLLAGSLRWLRFTHEGSLAPESPVSSAPAE
jgi:LEA14-like dessication related protein